MRYNNAMSTDHFTFRNPTQNALEAAKTYLRLRSEDVKITLPQIAKQFGICRSNVQKAILILKSAPPEEIASLEAGDLRINKIHAKSKGLMEQEIDAGCGCSGIVATPSFKKILDRRLEEIANQKSATLPANSAHDKHQKRIDLGKKR